MKYILSILFVLISFFASAQRDTIRVRVAGGGTVAQSIEYLTSFDTTATVSNSATWLVVNPPTLEARLIITLPASPTNGHEVLINFGGTITTGNVITNLTVLPNSGQSLVGSGQYGVIEVRDILKYKYSSSLSKWFRN